MSEEQIKELIKDYISKNLSIETETIRGSYGMSDTVKIKIYLEGEEVSYTYLD